MGPGRDSRIWLCLAYGLAAVLLSALVGCAAAGSQPAGRGAGRKAERLPHVQVPAANINQEALEYDLRSFENDFQSLIGEAADSIADHTSNPEIRRASVLWKTRMVTEVQDSISSAPRPLPCSTYGPFACGSTIS